MVEKMRIEVAYEGFRGTQRHDLHMNALTHCYTTPALFNHISGRRHISLEICAALVQ